MRINSSLDQAGLELRDTAPTNQFEGRMYEDTTAKEMKVILDGASRSVVTKDQAQNLSNKSLTKPVIATVVQTPQATPTAGSFPPVGQYYYYTKDTDNKLYQIDSNGVETLVGGNYNVDEIKSQIGNSGVTYSIPMIDVPYTQISGRTKIADYSQDLGVRWGVTRHLFSGQLLPMLGELCFPKAGIVYGIESDVENLVRFVGTGWTSQLLNSGATGVAQTLGPVKTGTLGDYLEITFWGTGLSIITRGSPGTSDCRITVDNGVETTYSFVDPAQNSFDNTSALAGKLYDGAARKVASGLTPGFHTVKIRFNTGMSLTQELVFCGYEVLMEKNDGNMTVNKGVAYKSGKKYQLSAHTNTSINAGIDGSPSLSKGAAVAVYLSAANTIGKVATVPAASTNFFPSTFTQSATESIFQKYYMQDFVAWALASGTSGNKFDFNNMAATAGSYFGQSQDGLATLSVVNGIYDAGPTFKVDNGGIIRITFFGTGIDIHLTSTVASRQWNWNIDGTFPAIAPTASPGAMNSVFKLASDLPLGWHTMEMAVQPGGGTGLLTFKSFTVYHPAKPEIPADAIRLCDYMLLPSYSYVSALNIASAGVMRKPMLRDALYVQSTGGTNAWQGSAVFQSSLAHSMYKFTDFANATVEVPFYGSGCELFLQSSVANGSSDVTLFLDDQIFLPASLLGVTYIVSSGLTFNSTTGSLSFNASTSVNESISISGLPVGMHRFKLKNNVNNKQMLIGGHSAITPIVGVTNQPLGYEAGVIMASNGIYSNPSRLPLLSQRKASLAPYNGTTTSTTTTVIPLGATASYSSQGETVIINWNGNVKHSAAASCYIQLWCGDVLIQGIGVTVAAGVEMPISFNQELRLPKGVYKFYLVASSATAGTQTYTGNLSIQKKSVTI